MWLLGFALLAGLPTCSNVLGYDDMEFGPDGGKVDGSAGKDAGSAGTSGEDAGDAGDTGGVEGGHDGSTDGTVGDAAETGADVATDGTTGGASVTGPAFAMSHESGANAPTGLNTIVDPTFTVTLSDPAAATHVSFQMAPWGDPPAWAEYGAWSSPLEPQWTHTVPFTTPGVWSARVLVTYQDGKQGESGHHAIECVKPTIAASVDNAAPVVGTTVTLSAAMTPPAAAGFPNTPDGWFANRMDAGWLKQNASNPITWTPGDTAWHDWVWVEMFPDGSRIHSNAVRVSPQDAPLPTEVHVAGGDCTSLQGGLDQAAAAGLPLRLTGTFTVNCPVRIPSSVQINGQQATFQFTKAGRIRNKTNGGGGGYTHAGGFVWDGGTFVGAGNGIFTISHSPGFTIKNTVQYAYAETGDDGHAIEVNASGGPHTPHTYTVHITGNTFRGVTGQRENANDEPVQYDFSWDGSGGDAPFDETMCHNLYIANNTFHRLDESGTWKFALCAIGAHRGSAGEPAERHNGILIENNQIHGAVGATANVSPDKGAIALWNARDVWIRNNGFHGCTPTRLISGWDANPSRALNDATMNINISGNTHDGGAVTITMPSSNTTGG